MPTSSFEPTGDVISFAIYWNPDSILDIGPGFGKYGFLLREYLDISQGRVMPIDWAKRIDSLEIWKPFEHFKSVYSSCYKGDIRTFPIGKYGLAVMADVIEHMSKKDGHKVIKRLLKRCKHLIITTPIGFMKQDKRFIKLNKYEKHLSGWLPEDFKPYKAVIKTYSSVMLVRIDA